MIHFDALKAGVTFRTAADSPVFFVKLDNTFAVTALVYEERGMAKSCGEYLPTELFCFKAHDVVYSAPRDPLAALNTD